MNHYEEEYYKDRNLMQADQLEEERKLWQWIEDNPIAQNVVKATPIESKKSYLYNPDNQIDPEFNLQL